MCRWGERERERERGGKGKRLAYAEPVALDGRRDAPPPSVPLEKDVDMLERGRVGVTPPSAVNPGSDTTVSVTALFFASISVISSAVVPLKPQKKNTGRAC